MQPIRLIRENTKPDMYLVLYDKELNSNSSCSTGGVRGMGVVAWTYSGYGTPDKQTVIGAINLDYPDVAVLCRFRERTSTTNVFSVYAEKIRSGAFGEALLRWPYYSLCGNLGYYDLEVSVTFGLRTQTCVSTIPFKLEEDFARGGRIADDENVLFRDGNLYLRNMDTGDLFGVSLSGTTTPTITISTAPTVVDIPVAYTGSVVLMVVSGELYLYNPDDASWRMLSLIGSTTVPALQVGARLENINSSNVQSLSVTLKNGKFYMKRLATSEWHCVELRGATGIEHLTLGTGATL